MLLLPMGKQGQRDDGSFRWAELASHVPLAFLFNHSWLWCVMILSCKALTTLRHGSHALTRTRVILTHSSLHTLRDDEGTVFKGNKLDSLGFNFRKAQKVDACEVPWFLLTALTRCYLRATRGQKSLCHHICVCRRKITKVHDFMQTL